MSALNSTFLSVLLQVETDNGGLTSWGVLLILGLVILVVVLALAWNASRTKPPHVEHPAVERLESVEQPVIEAHEVVEVPPVAEPLEEVDLQRAVGMQEEVEVQEVVEAQGSAEPMQPPIPQVADIEPDAAPAPAPDDLAIIEGIGPRIASLLQEHGISTFDQLAHTNLDELRGLLRNAGLQISDPSSWAEQAALAARGDWAGLQALQDRLKGGRL